MRIIFICGSLEPGRDGVGDYTRRLAGELIHQGHEIEIIAIMDKLALKQITERQEYGNLSILTNRLPFDDGYRSNCINARRLIDSFRPDWVSLQYVPFSFGKKGIHRHLGRTLAHLAEQCKFHIMFHEMWIGRHKGTSYKKKILSIIQQLQIKNLIKAIEPDLIHTHLPIYQSHITTIGKNSLPLPLFSNIDVVAEQKPVKSHQVFKFAFFSQISTADVVIKFINDFSILLKNKNIIAELIFIGGNMDKMRNYIPFFKEACPNILKISATGFLNEIGVSRALADCDLGITPIPFHALGKSGSIAAFFSHGIPVAAPVLPSGNFKIMKSFFYAKEADSVITEAVWSKYVAAKAAALLVYQDINVSAIANLFHSDLAKNSKNTVK